MEPAAVTEMLGIQIELPRATVDLRVIG